MSNDKINKHAPVFINGNATHRERPLLLSICDAVVDMVKTSINCAATTKQRIIIN